MILFYLKMKPSGEVSFFLFDQKPNQILNQQIASHKATPMKCLDQDNISAQLKLEGWLYNVLSFYLYSFQRRGTLLQVILERRLHFIGYLREEQPFYWVNLRGSWRSFLFISKTRLEVGWCVILWSILYLEGWSSRSSYFIGVAEYPKFQILRGSYDLVMMIHDRMSSSEMREEVIH